MWGSGRQLKKAAEQKYSPKAFPTNGVSRWAAQGEQGTCEVTEEERDGEGPLNSMHLPTWPHFCYLQPKAS